MYGTKRMSVFIKKCCKYRLQQHLASSFEKKKKGKLHEYEMLGLSSILVRISLHGDATSAFF